MLELCGHVLGQTSRLYGCETSANVGQLRVDGVDLGQDILREVGEELMDLSSGIGIELSLDTRCNSAVGRGGRRRTQGRWRLGRRRLGLGVTWAALAQGQGAAAGRERRREIGNRADARLLLD
jgi:hypothetical protein